MSDHENFPVASSGPFIGPATKKARRPNIEEIAEFAGLEFAGLENDGLENDGVEQEQTYAFKVIGYCLKELEPWCPVDTQDSVRTVRVA